MRRPWWPAMFLLAGACGSGEEPPPDVDAGTPGDGGVIDNQDAGTPPPVMPNENVTISGRTLRLDSYLAGDIVAVGESAVQALGVNGVSPVASAADGTYSISVPQNGNVILQASKPQYLQTYEAVTVSDRDVPGRTFYLAYEPHVQILANRFGVDFDTEFGCHAPNIGMCKYSVLMGRVVDDGSYDNGIPTPMAGVTKEEFTLRGEGDANYYRKGPYFFFFNGQPDANATATRRERNAAGKYQGGLFLFFVEMPTVGPNSKNFEVNAASAAGGVERRYFGPAQVKVYRNGFTWTTIRESGVAPPPPEMPPPPPPVDVDFDTQIYPLFLPVNQGGYGCLGCHTNLDGAQPAGNMNLYGGPDVAFASLDPARYPNRVNVANASASYLLTKPLYEADGPQNHPIFAFLSETEPAYQLIYGWIRGGALRLNNTPPPPVSFYNDVRPLLYRDNANGGIGCYSCHVSGVNAANAPGGAYFGGNGNELWNVLTSVAPSDNGGTGEPYRINKAGQTAQSLVLTNPLLGTPEPHPAKLLSGTDDPRYQTLYRWISEGYVNDSPP